MNPTAPLPWARRQPFHPRFRLTGGRRRPISRAVLALLPPIRLARPPTPPSLPGRRAVESARPPICVTHSLWWASSARRPTPLPPPPPSASKCGATRGPPCREDCAADASTPSDNELRLDWLPRLHIMDVLRYLGNAGLPVLGISVNPSLCFLAADSVGGILTHHSWTATAAGPIRIADSPASPCCPYFGGEERAPAELRLEGVAPEVNMRRSDWSCWAFLDPLPAASQRRHRPTSTSTADSPAAASHSDDPAVARRHGAVAASHSRPGGVPARPPAAAAPRRPGAAASRRRGFRGDARGAPLAPSPRSLAVR